MVVQVERDEVERPLVAQLEAMGWTHVPGGELDTLDADMPLLVDQLGPTLHRINVRGSDGQPWMDAGDIRRSVQELASVSLGKGVVAANLAATQLLLHGWTLPTPSAAHGGASATVQYIEWHPDRLTLNTFTVVDQLRVRDRSGELSILDVVLFVNGIPLAAVECKSPDLAEPVRSAVLDLRYYAGLPVEDLDDPQPPAGVPELFRTVQLLVAATGETAHLGTVTSEPEHFHPWRSVEPENESALRRELRTAGLLADGADPKRPLSEQQKLVGVVLRPAGLLNVVRHYVIPMTVESESAGGAARTVKAVARHQQYRATEKAVRRLLTGRLRAGEGTEDERGGVIWHTQGSGKSLTMTFLVRRVHLHHRLSEFMVVVVTDRTQLQTQLSRTLKLSESDVETAKTRTQMEGLLRDGGRRVVFGMIQKYGTGFTFAGDAEGSGDDRDLVAGEESQEQEAEEVAGPVPVFSECNPSPDILVLIDEAHRSHTSVLHSALRKAIPNAAKIGFTGTPIITGRESDTRRIFGRGDSERGFLDEYRMEDAEHDGVVVRIRYEGRTGEGAVIEGETLDRQFDDLVRDRTREEKDRLLRKWPTDRDVAESIPMIEAKAADILEHWVTTVLPGGFKAQVAAVSRKAAVRYHRALRNARDELLAELATFDPESVTGTPPEKLTKKLRYLHQAYQFRALLRRIDFVPVISPGAGSKRGEWREWTDSGRQEAYTGRFQKAFPALAPDEEWVAVTPFNPPPQPAPPTDAPDLSNPWSATSDAELPPLPASVPDPVHPESPIAFLIVKSMLLTGFDAPREQVLYLDRPIRDAELLQAVARVNRTSPGKKVGYVVDYYGVFEHLSSALAGYRNVDVDDTMRPLSDEVKKLRPAADEVRGFLRSNGIDDAALDQLAKLGPAALALQSEELRLDFDGKLNEFLAVLERALPHEAALDYVADARRWGLLQKRVRRLFRDAGGGTFTLRRYGRKVQAMIADHLEGPEIDQVIPPVSLTALTFDDAVRRLPPEEAAAEMGHALRFHLEERTRHEDPAKYTQLSARLEEILRTMPGRFDDQVAAFGPLIAKAREQQEETPELAGLSPIEQKVFRLLEQTLGETEGVRLTDGGDIRQLTGAVCDVATVTMAKASYQGQSQDLSTLASVIHGALLGGGVRPVGADWAPVDSVAERLAAFAQNNQRQFRGRARGE
ncbi:type I restriction endonuclease subunit R [Streptomyces sp. NBC_01197]|uniref:type I restriction endonuclease subunit R n=1 Tax=Streptomyces sp. NBC_01197 TaxID=2903768 RepID=UPI002E16795C|nr:type I restriction endonuclease [Streptomyces sp. NBC_01197]